MASEVTESGVKNVYWLASQLPEGEYLNAGDVVLHIRRENRGFVTVDRVPIHLARQVAQELKADGQRISTLYWETFHLFYHSPTAWHALAEKAVLPVELGENGGLSSLPTPRPPRLGQLKLFFQGAFLGRHNLGGVVGEDIDSLAEQILRAKPGF